MLLQRYVENEPYEHGKRPEIYARMRSLAPKLLQVPEYQGKPFFVLSLNFGSVKNTLKIWNFYEYIFFISIYFCDKLTINDL